MTFCPRFHLSNSWVHIACICPFGWDPGKLLQEDSQTVCSFYLHSSSPDDKFGSRLGERGCISCRVAPRNGGSILCQHCYDGALRKGPVIVEVPEDHENYKSGASIYTSLSTSRTDRPTVESQFKQSWRHNSACPVVRAVYKIINTEASLKKYEEYLYDSFIIISDLTLVY